MTDPEYELDPGRVKEMLDAGEAEVIDVRRPDEREAEYIAGTRHVELASLQDRNEDGKVLSIRQQLVLQQPDFLSLHLNQLKEPMCMFLLNRLQLM